MSRCWVRDENRACSTGNRKAGIKISHTERNHRWAAAERRAITGVLGIHKRAWRKTVFDVITVSFERFVTVDERDTVVCVAVNLNANGGSMPSLWRTAWRTDWLTGSAILRQHRWHADSLYQHPLWLNARRRKPLELFPENLSFSASAEPDRLTGILNQGEGQKSLSIEEVEA